MLVIFQYAQKKAGQACFGRPVKHSSYFYGHRRLFRDVDDLAFAHFPVAQSIE
jgi:hypothetical protein